MCEQEVAYYNAYINVVKKKNHLTPHERWFYIAYIINVCRCKYNIKLIDFTKNPYTDGVRKEANEE